MQRLGILRPSGPCPTERLGTFRMEIPVERAAPKYTIWRGSQFGMSKLSVLVYPDTGSRLSSTLINASLYFDKVYILRHYVTQQRALEHRELLRDPTLRRRWDETLTLPLITWVEQIADYGELYESVKPLVKEGIIEYAWKIHGTEKAATEKLFTFANELLKSQDTESPLPEEERVQLLLVAP